MWMASGLSYEESIGAVTFMIISIHAPAKRATKPLKAFICVHKISIHAPAKGATAKLTKKANSI